MLLGLYMLIAAVGASEIGPPPPGRGSSYGTARTETSTNGRGQSGEAFWSLEQSKLPVGEAYGSFAILKVLPVSWVL